MRRLALVVFIAGSSPAAADSMRVVGEAAAYAGALRTTSAGSDIQPLAGLRAIVAARLEPFQLGLVFDAMHERKAVGGIGIQLHADLPLNRCWRIGARASLSLSTYDSLLGAPDDTDGVSYGFKRHGYYWMLGAQARHRDGALGIDFIRTRDGGIHYERTGVGVLANASFTERRGAYGVLALAAGSAMVAVISWIALRNVDTSQ